MANRTSRGEMAWLDSLGLLASFGLGIAATVVSQRMVDRIRHQKHQLNGTKPAKSTEAKGSNESLKYVHPPHPTWTPGMKQPHPFSSDEMLGFDPSIVEVASMYSLMISAVVPRPVGFVSSMSSDGSFNLAPYSYFNVMGHNPPILAIGCCRHGGRPANNGEPAKKDTLANIEETGEFVVNIISDWFVEAANFTCGDYDRGVNEMQLAGLTPVPSQKIKPPRVAESAVQMECKLRHVMNFEGRDGVQSLSVILGEVIMCHVHQEVTERSPTGKVVVDPIKLRPISRLGGVTYARIAELFELPRPNKDGTMPHLKTKASIHEQADDNGK